MTTFKQLPEAEPNRISERVEEEESSFCERKDSFSSESGDIIEDKFDATEYEEISRVKANDGIYEMSYLRKKNTFAGNVRD